MAQRRVRWLLLSWTVNGLGCVQEVNRLKQCFKDHIWYGGDTWLILSGLPQISLTRRLRAFVNESRNMGELLLIYYGGNGFVEGDGLCWVRNGRQDAPYLN